MTTTHVAHGGDLLGHPFTQPPKVAPNPGARLTVTVPYAAKEGGETMQAVAWYGKRDIRTVERPRPTITDPDDVVLRVSSTCICGSDLHLYNGYMPGMIKGDTLGHEFMGICEEVGPNVKSLKAGDRVVTAFDVACPACSFCNQQLYSSCNTSNPSADQAQLYGHRTGGFYGYSHLVGGFAGGQAEYVRVVFADVNCLKVPADLPDEKAVLLTDILPTAWWACEMGGVQSGSNVAIWGAGPVGILAAQCAFHRGAAAVVLIDCVDYRLEHAAAKIPGLRTINYKEFKVDRMLREMFPEMQGPDVCIEAVGVHYPKTLLHSAELKLGLETDPADVLNELIFCARKGGTISIVGAYVGYTNHFNIGAFMEKGLTMRGGQTPVQRFWKILLAKVETGELDPSIVVTHVLPGLSQASAAYKMFDSKQPEDRCIKVIFKPGQREGAQEPSPA